MDESKLLDRPNFYVRGLMGFLGRAFWLITGLEKKRVPRQLELSGAPRELVAQAKGCSDEEQEGILIGFAEGEQLCLVDWRDDSGQIYDALMPLLSDEERKLLPSKNALPAKGALAIAAIREALAASERTLVHSESLGDHSLTFLVPRKVAGDFVRCVGPWRID
jgi:hypothetical protein